MKKRIRLHQLRVGMFIEDWETSIDGYAALPRSFLVSDAATITSILAEPLLSLVINVKKGLDVVSASGESPKDDCQRIRTEIQEKFSVAEIRQARTTISASLPHIRQVLFKARTGGGFQMQAAELAVDQIMSAAASNGHTLLSLMRLRHHNEATYLHSLSVSLLMVMFGRLQNLSDDRIRLLGLGGLVHDIGKAVLPRELLQKSGKLTPEEFRLIQTHPDRGMDILDRNGETPPDIKDICLHHHEKFNGSGYPRKLAGTAIPLVARIATICDVYDALTSVRPYKRAMTSESAVSTMHASPGHFDPGLLSMFIDELVIPAQTGRPQPVRSS